MRSKSQTKTILISICARAGSKGVPGKNARLICGKPLIAHTVIQAVDWKSNHFPSAKIVVSTDGAELASIAREYGADVPFLRPQELANDTIGKIPVLIHALEKSEAHYAQKFDLMLDLDPTSPLRTADDINRGLSVYSKSNTSVCFSVTKPKKNPYFNVVERKFDGSIGLVKTGDGPALRRQEANEVWDMNAAIYFYERNFLLRRPNSLWDGKPEIFLMPPQSAFDIDEETDFIATEALMKKFAN